MYGFNVEGLQLEETVRKGFPRGWMSEITILRMLVRASPASFFLWSVNVDDIRMTEEEAHSGTHVEKY